MKNIFALVACLFVVLPMKSQGTDASYVPTAENLQARETFQDNKLGIFIHWGVYSMLGDGEWVMHSKRINRDEYAQLPAGFCPSRFDAKEWAKAFKDAGAKYVTFTSRHHDGFSMWGSAASDYNVVDATPFKRDVVKELAQALGEEGLKLHLYYSHMDWKRTDYPLGTASNVLPHDEKDTNWPAYYRFMNQQLTELLTQYGPIGAIWFDGEWDHPKDFDWQLPEQYALIHRLQPACLVGNNHHHPVAPGEDIQIFEQDMPGENTTGFANGQTVSTANPLESCITMNNSWGYNITDKSYKSGKDIIQILVRLAGMNANLLLNIGPRPDGKLPDEALQLLKEIGQWMKANGETIYKTRGGLVSPQSWGVTTQRGNRLFVHILNHDKAELTLPIAGKKVKNAMMFADKKPVKLVKSKNEVTLCLDSVPSGTDTIVEVVMK